MDLHPDFSDLLAEFARCGVSYALIGGYAVGVYAEPRATKDHPPVRIDLLRSADGIDTEKVIQRANVVDVGPHRIPVIARNDLIQNKKAAGRPQDLADVAALEKAPLTP